MNIKITADSTCDISVADLKRHNIDLFPLDVIIDGQAYKDGVDIFPADLINAVEKEKKTCSTAAISIGDYWEKFEKYSKDYDAVIHISLGDGFSSCYNNARMASEDMPNVYIVNSKSISSGQGGLVLYACDLVRSGFEPEEIVKILNETVDHVRFTFLIDGLEYLQRGGRCSAAIAIGANLLKIKPCIECVFGELEVGKKYRGAMNKCIREYVKDQIEQKENVDSRRAILVYLGIDKKTVERTKQTLEESGKFDEVLCYEAGCTITSHCGPGTIGIYILDK